MKYNFGFKVEHQLCKDNLTLILGREKEIQTYGQLNTTLAQMCPDLPTGPTDDMEQMTWLGLIQMLCVNCRLGSWRGSWNWVFVFLTKAPCRATLNYHNFAFPDVPFSS